MEFSKALYYPSIDIDDERWLKSAVLFWNEINTIVPKAINNPYNNYSTQYLYDEEIIKPIYVNNENKYVMEVSSNFIKFLNSDEGWNLLKNSSEITGDEAILHKHKMAYYLLEKLERQKFDEDGFYHLDSALVSYYMTLLANSISEDKSLALVSNNLVNSKLTDTIRYDNNIQNRNRYNYYDEYVDYDFIKQGLLTNIVIKNICIEETTSLEDIVSFRRHYSDELARFRVNLAKLVSPIEDIYSLDALSERLNTIYTDEFLPAYNDLQFALNSYNIKWFFDNISKLSIFSVSTTALPVMLGVDVPQALLIGTGVSAVSSAVAYNIKKRENLRKNPYTYLLKINSELC